MPCSMKRTLVKLIVPIVLVLLCSLGILADGSPVKIKADTLTGDSTTKNMKLKGNVVITYKNIKIEADSAEFNTETNFLTLSGKVKFWQDNDKLEGDLFTYDLKKEVGQFKNGRVVSDAEKGKVYIKGSEFSVSPKTVKIIDGSLTTCDLDDPHYHISAGLIEVYLDDKLVIKNVSYYEGRFRLFYWPSLVIPLKQNDSFELPRIGHDTENGWFIESSFNYQLNPKSIGLLRVGYYEKKGLGLAAKHGYEINNAGKGSIELGLKKNLSSGYQEIKAEWTHDYTNGPLKLQTVVGGLLTSYTKNVVNSYRLNLTRAVDSSSLNVSYRQDYGARTPVYDLSYLHRFSRNTSISLSSRLEKRTGFTPDDLVPVLSYNAVLNDSGAYGSLSAVYSTKNYVDHPLDRYSDGWLRKLPELSLQTRPIQLLRGGPKLTAKFTWARYDETRVIKRGLTPSEDELRSVTAEQKAYTANLDIATFNIFNRLPVNLAMTGFQQSFDNISYNGSLQSPSTINQKRYTLSAASSLNVNENLKLTGSYSLQKSIVDGPSPFSFGQTSQMDGNSIYYGAVYNKKWINASVNNGYNIDYDFLYPVQIQLGLSPSQNLRMDGTASIDPYFGLTSASGFLSYINGQQTTIKLGAKASLAGLQQVEGQIDVKLGETWRVKAAMVYDTNISNFSNSYLTIVRELHCRQLSFSVRPQGSSFRAVLEYRINAFPNSGLNIGAGEDGIQFNLIQQPSSTIPVMSSPNPGT